MSDVRKVPASAGAEWLLGGFGLLRKAPLELGLLGVIYGVISLLPMLAIKFGMGPFVATQLLVILVGPLLLGGFIYAARHVDQGGKPTPGDLLRGTNAERAPRLLAMLLPRIAATVICGLLFVAMIDTSQLLEFAQAIQALQGQANPDPQQVAGLMEGFPFGAFLLWLLLLVVVFVIASFFTFAAYPEVMFTDRGAFAAMGRSFRACLRNLPAMLVFFLLTMVAVFAIYIAVMIVGVIVNLLVGAMAMQVAVQLLLMAVFMPLMTGAMYFAWRQMLGDGVTAPPPLPASGGIEV